MRMNARDPEAEHYEVWCDGRLLVDCVAVDTDAGTAVIYERSPGGLIRMDSSTGEPATRVITGEMEVRGKAEPPS